MFGDVVWYLCLFCYLFSLNWFLVFDGLFGCLIL